MIQNALHCVTPAKLYYDGWDVRRDHLLVFQHSPEVSLRRFGRQPALLFGLWQGFEIVPVDDTNPPGSYRLKVTHYQYKVMAYDGREIVVFHWHPGRGGMDSPHLHVGSLLIDSTRHDLGRRFSSLHLPTGRIPVEQVVEALITQFDVTPIRADWQRLLDAGQSAFRQTRT